MGGRKWPAKQVCGYGDDDKRITLTAEVGEEIVAKNKAFGKRNRLSMPHLFDNASADLACWKAPVSKPSAETAPRFVSSSD